MAPRIGRIIDQENGFVIDEDELSPAQKENQDRVETILNAFQESGDDEKWYIKVHRVTGNNKLGMKEPFLFNCSVEELPIDERLRDEYGTGIYRCRAYRNGILFRGFTVEIEKADRPSAASPSGPSDMQALMQAFQNSQAQMMAMLETKLLAPPQQAADPFAMMERMSTIMANLGGIAKPASDDKIDILIKGMELAKDIGSGGDTNFMDVFKEVLRSPIAEGFIGAAMAKNGQNGQQQATHQLPINNRPLLQRQITPTPVATPTAPPNMEGMDTNQMNVLIQTQLHFLVDKAKKGSDPELYAELIMDNLPDAALDYILSSQNIIGELSAINPGVAQHVGWFQNLLTAVRLMDEEDKNAASRLTDSVDPNKRRPGGDVANPPNDGSDNKTV